MLHYFNLKRKSIVALVAAFALFLRSVRRKMERKMVGIAQG